MQIKYGVMKESYMPPLKTNDPVRFGERVEWSAGTVVERRPNGIWVVSPRSWPEGLEGLRSRVVASPTIIPGSIVDELPGARALLVQFIADLPGLMAKKVQEKLK